METKRWLDHLLRSKCHYCSLRMKRSYITFRLKIQVLFLQAKQPANSQFLTKLKHVALHILCSQNNLTLHSKTKMITLNCLFFVGFSFCCLFVCCFYCLFVSCFHWRVLPVYFARTRLIDWSRRQLIECSELLECLFVCYSFQTKFSLLECLFACVCDWFYLSATFCLIGCFLSVCLPVRLIACLLVCSLACLLVWLFVWLFVWLISCLPVCFLLSCIHRRVPWFFASRARQKDGS